MELYNAVMTYAVLASFFLASALIALLTLIGLVVLLFRNRYTIALVQRYRVRIAQFYLLWFLPYGLFILFFTGPVNLQQYPDASTSPYKLPWKAGVRRFVSQGNRSFTSHRDFYEYSWDFWMPIGTEVLAARDGRVVEVEDSLNGIGMKSNFIAIEHEDGTRAIYAHIRQSGSLAKIGDQVKQCQAIALSGMVGQTVNPHLHFDVVNSAGTASMPISFRDVAGGVPLAGRFYESGCTSTYSY